MPTVDGKLAGRQMDYVYIYVHAREDSRQAKSPCEQAAVHGFNYYSRDGVPVSHHCGGEILYSVCSVSTSGVDRSRGCVRSRGQFYRDLEEKLYGKVGGKQKVKGGWYVHAPDPELLSLANQLSAVQEMMQLSMENNILCMDHNSELGCA